MWYVVVSHYGLVCVSPMTNGVDCLYVIIIHPGIFLARFKVELNFLLKALNLQFCIWDLSGYMYSWPLNTEGLNYILLLFSYPVVSDSWWPDGLQHARPLCPSPSSKVCPSSCPLNCMGPLKCGYFSVVNTTVLHGLSYPDQGLFH